MEQAPLSSAAVAHPDAAVGVHPLAPRPWPFWVLCTLRQHPADFSCAGGWVLLTPDVVQGQPHLIFSKECNQSRRESETAAAVPVKDECLVVI